MKQRILLCLLIIIGQCIFAAEFRDNVLFIEVNIAVRSDLQIEPLGGAIHVSDESNLFSSSYSRPIEVAVVAHESVSLYGILDRIEANPPGNSEDAIERQYFVWEKNQLTLKRELQFFHPQSFTDIEEAKAYANLMNYPFKNIQSIPVVNSTLKITSGKNNVRFFETPLRIVCDTEMLINGAKYQGEFIIKIRDGKLIINQVLPLEEYITGVIPNEIGNLSPLQAMKAQAVAARTHAISLLLNNRHSKDGYDLCSDTHCQVYRGKHLVNKTVSQAVAETSGEILIFDGKVADATYHSSCGGKTESSVNVWKSKPIPHLAGITCIPGVSTYDLRVESEACDWIDTRVDSSGMSSWEKGTLNWEKSISTSQLAANVGLEFIDKIDILERGDSGRILRLKLSGDRSITLENEYKIRLAFGSLLSSFFYFKGARGKTSYSPSSTIVVKGRGAGHGVGLCQVGTLKMARDGKEYHQILEKYYPGTEINADWMFNE